MISTRIAAAGRCLIAAALLLAAASTFAQTAPRWNEDRLDWQPSPVCADPPGSPRTDCPGTGFRIETAATVGATTWAPVAVTAPTARSYLVTGLARGPHCYRIREESADGGSTWAGPVCATATQPVPGAPIVTVDLIAYNAKPDADRLAYTKRQVVGTVALGTPCDTSRPIADGHYAVERAAVAWSSWRRTDRPVVKCDEAAEPAATTASLGGLTLSVQ